MHSKVALSGHEETETRSPGTILANPDAHSPAPMPLVEKQEVTLEIMEFVEKVRLQRRVIILLLRTFWVILAATMPIYYLQGFGLWGFHLSDGLLKWLGGVTAGEIAGLLTLALGGIFTQKNGR